MAELEHLIPLDRIPARGAEIEVVAAEAEREALARRFAIPAIQHLRCRFRLRREGPGIIGAEGVLDARVDRVCVISLDEFTQDVVEAFELRFVPAGDEGRDDDPDEPDLVPYAGQALDLGEAAAEQLALALDPYPHKPGVELPESDLDDAEPTSAPFAALARLRKN